MLVTINGKFDAGHYLTKPTEYNEKCLSMHGHTYRYSFTVEGLVDFTTDMVIDFGELKSKIALEIKNRLDHKNLNEIMPNPTAERVLLYIVDLIKETIWYNEMNVRLEEVTLNETDDCKVTWRKYVHK